MDQPNLEENRIQRGGLMPEQTSSIEQTDCRPGQAKREAGSQRGGRSDILRFPIRLRLSGKTAWACPASCAQPGNARCT